MMTFLIANKRGQEKYRRDLSDIAQIMFRLCTIPSYYNSGNPTLVRQRWRPNLPFFRLWNGPLSFFIHYGPGPIHRDASLVH